MGLGGKRGRKARKRGRASRYVHLLAPRRTVMGAAEPRAPVENIFHQIHEEGFRSLTVTFCSTPCLPKICGRSSPPTPTPSRKVWRLVFGLTTDAAECTPPTPFLLSPPTSLPPPPSPRLLPPIKISRCQCCWWTWRGCVGFELRVRRRRRLWGRRCGRHSTNPSRNVPKNCSRRALRCTQIHRHWPR